MLDFEFYAPTRILFGRDSLNSLPEQLGKAGAARILLVHSGGSGTKAAVDGVKKLLEGEGFSYAEFSGIQPNPLLSRALAGAETCKKEKRISSWRWAAAA